MLSKSVKLALGCSNQKSATKILLRGITKKSSRLISGTTVCRPSTQLKKTLDSRTLWYVHNETQRSNMAVMSKEENREFMAFFPDIVKDLTEATHCTDFPEVSKRFAKVIEYTVPNGKKIRSWAMVASYKLLEKPERITPEKLRLAFILGWCIEVMQAFVLIVDDLLDNSETRRKAPCWFRKEDVGIQALNDAIMLENAMYYVLRKHFSDLPCYTFAMEVFHDAILKTSIGQALDYYVSCKDGKPNLNLFTNETYTSLAKYKTSYWGFHAPVALSMYLANKFDPELHRQAKTILLEMGHFYQVQNDFRDCFGDSEATGKNGNDISEGKCTWLATVTLQKANPSQRQIMEENYGCPEPKAIAAIRSLYEELGLPNEYAIYEENTFKLMRTRIQQISKALPPKLFLQFLERLYMRSS